MAGLDTVAFRLMADTGALMAALDRVNRAALELAQAVDALQRAQFKVSVELTERANGPQGRPAARSCSGAAGNGSEDAGADAPAGENNA